ncbi:anthranilate synthase family protein [Pseudomonas sp. Irchel s3h17]|uniref:anthranilate synthase family protein n=1 Tax=Pseudomonas sp. Irchel s3h17 TaxID=2009182 RepID=UPI003530940B
MSPPAYALIYRPESANGDSVEILTGTVEHLEKLADLSRCYRPRASTIGGHDVLAIIPYRQITERGFECVDDKEPLIALTIDAATTLSKREVLEQIPDTGITISGEHYDIDDDAYAETALKIIKDEIGMGAGSNFVLKRSFLASIDDFSHRKALTLFRRLLQQEIGAYWIFIIHTGDRVFVGATPERHVSMEQNVATMNPISGTYRYPASGPSVEGVLDFLSDSKETEELYMVVDEELKMMGNVCTLGGTIEGPYLKAMTRLAHTEYLIKGETQSEPWEILRETLFAPTITGSPLENACRVIKKYEPEGRAYYSGIVALLGRERSGQHYVDSSILIRTADINKYGTIRISTGSTLVRNSNPTSEAAETRAKASGLLSALGVLDTTAGTLNSKPGEPSPENRYKDLVTHPRISAALNKRNDHISSFWQASAKDRARPQKELEGLRVLVLDAEDTFTSMICHQLSALSLSVTVANANKPIDYNGYDIFVLGPGPGDPCDQKDARINSLHNAVKTLLEQRRPFLAVCLSHQVLCSHLGLELMRKETPNQGTQKEIDLFGVAEKVGFYNTFAAMTNCSELQYSKGITIEVSHDIQSGEVHALRGPLFSSFQFHPESVLTQHGAKILGTAICDLLK